MQSALLPKRAAHGTRGGYSKTPAWCSTYCGGARWLRCEQASDSRQASTPSMPSPTIQPRFTAARLKLLRAFPTRSTNRQLLALDGLLTSALDHPDKAKLRALARDKQSLKSVPVAQRVRWWATDALISQGDRFAQFRRHLAASETRVRHLARFLEVLWDRFDGRRSILTTITDPPTLHEMIEMLGRWYATPTYRGGYVTLEMHMTELIQQLIQQLGRDASDEARQALDRLVEDPQLAGWRRHLIVERDGQRVLHRDASYRHPGVEEVQAALRDLTPANAAGLAALAACRLNDFSERVRGDSTNIWSQFWNQDRHGHPDGPKPENACRDALLAALREALRRHDGVEATPEGACVSGWRADILLSCGDFNVPVEVKRSSHRNLWTAIRTQLIGQYTIDPATSGYGVYAVLWCGHEYARRPPHGDRPRTPRELEQRLTQALTEVEARQDHCHRHRRDQTPPAEPALTNPGGRSGLRSTSVTAMFAGQYPSQLTMSPEGTRRGTTRHWPTSITPMLPHPRVVRLAPSSYDEDDISTPQRDRKERDPGRASRALPQPAQPRVGASWSSFPE